MPRKKSLKKEQITVVLNGEPVNVVLHPPTKTRKAWYASWSGLKFSRSTGTSNLEDAVSIAESMVRNGGVRKAATDSAMSDEEFEQIQRAHFGRKSDPDRLRRAKKSLESCIEAILVFKMVTGLERIATATPDDCARFQREALLKPKSWRLTYPNRRTENVNSLSPTTVDKWSRGLQAAFERANLNAGKKCVRGVVAEAKLLRANPWHQFTWIEKRKKPIRHFNDDELASVIDFFESKWPHVSIAPLAAKLCFWTWSRVSELAQLRWGDLRVHGSEYHFQIVGKHGIEKWARIPNGLHSALSTLRTGSEFVLAPYTDQLRTHHQETGRELFASNVSSVFRPQLIIDWFQDRLTDWAEQEHRDHAYPHVFRKTALKRARMGETRLADRVADDAKLSASVLVNNYAPDDDELMRQASNRMFLRLIEGLPDRLLQRYGHSVETTSENLHDRLRKALEVQDWSLVAKLANDLAHQGA